MCDMCKKFGIPEHLPKEEMEKIIDEWAYKKVAESANERELAIRVAADLYAVLERSADKFSAVDTILMMASAMRNYARCLDLARRAAAGKDQSAEKSPPLEAKNNGNIH